MNSDYEKLLESEIDRELKRLPSLQAPATLARRVMQQLESRAALPWYRQSFLAWPFFIRATAFTFLAAMFAGLCVGTWQLTQLPSVGDGIHQFGNWFAGAGRIFNVLNALASTALLVVKQMHTGVLIGCLAAGALGYALCLGLGAVYFRLGMAARR
jgi:hypothetical protein